MTGFSHRESDSVKLDSVRCVKVRYVIKLLYFIRKKNERNISKRRKSKNQGKSWYSQRLKYLKKRFWNIIQNVPSKSLFALLEGSGFRITSSLVSVIILLIYIIEHVWICINNLISQNLFGATRIQEGLLVSSNFGH